MDGRQIVMALQGQWRGNRGMCRCPAHPDRTPSLLVTDRDGRTLVYCYAGCPQGPIIDALRSRGLWEGRKPDEPVPVETGEQRRRAQENEAREQRRLEQSIESALAIWSAGAPVEGTLAERYLTHARKIPGPFPSTLRFASNLMHWPSKLTLPALLCACQAPDGTITGLQRIYLDPSGNRKADVEPVKMTVGSLGDGAVRLGEPGAILGLAEGPETGLSAQHLYDIPIWVTCGVRRLDKLTLPKSVTDLIIFADRGAVAEAWSRRAIERYGRQGIIAASVEPPVWFKDFNDLLYNRWSQEIMTPS